MSILNKNTGLYKRFDMSAKSKMSDLVLDDIRLVKQVVDDFIESGKIANNDRYCAEYLSMCVLSPWILAAEKNREYVVADKRTIGQLKIIYDACTYAIENNLYDAEKMEGVDGLKRFLDRHLKRYYGSDKDFSQYKYDSTK